MTDSDSITQTQTIPVPASEGQAPAPTPAHSPSAHNPSQPRNERRHEGGQAREGAPREPRPPRQLREENTIFIGRKATMGYVLAVVTQFQNGAPQVKIKARGKIISQAVDVAEIVRRRFLPEVKVHHIGIQTEDVENEDHSRSKVSSIEIVLAK